MEYNIKALTRKHVATGIAVGTSAALVLLPDGPQGFGSGGFLLWPLFGTSNQLLAGISLLLISIWLKRKGRNYIYTLIPMAFLLFVTLWAMIQQVVFKWSGMGSNHPQWLLFIMGGIILVFTFWILITAISSFRQTAIVPLSSKEYS